MQDLDLVSRTSAAAGWKRFPPIICRKRLPVCTFICHHLQNDDVLCFKVLLFHKPLSALHSPVNKTKNKQQQIFPDCGDQRLPALCWRVSPRPTPKTRIKGQSSSASVLLFTDTPTMSSFPKHRTQSTEHRAQNRVRVGVRAVLANKKNDRVGEEGNTQREKTHKFTRIKTQKSVCCFLPDRPE